MPDDGQSHSSNAKMFSIFIIVLRSIRADFKDVGPLPSTLVERDFDAISSKKIPSFRDASCSEHENFPHERILQGVPTTSYQWPWIARLKIADRRYKNGVCGGTVIANNFILTGKDKWSENCTLID